MRLFVAAEPSLEVRLAAAEAALSLRKALERNAGFHGIRWIPSENLHLTVWFLGEVPDERAPLVLKALAPPLRHGAFRLHLSGLGAFPPSGSPRVLWMGVADGLEPLTHLHGEVGARLKPLGFRADARPYSAHLTLARLKEPVASGARGMLRNTLKQLKADAGECSVDALTVFRSRTAPSGAVYESLLRVPLI